jgi:hypothetical protein
MVIELEGMGNSMIGVSALPNSVKSDGCQASSQVVGL